MTFDEFMKIVRETKEKNAHPERWTEAERLCHEIMTRQKSTEDYFKLEAEVKAFMQSDASEEDKQKVRGYTESLYMMISAIRDYGLDI